MFLGELPQLTLPQPRYRAHQTLNLLVREVGDGVALLPELLEPITFVLQLL